MKSKFESDCNNSFDKELLSGVVRVWRLIPLR